MIKFKQYHPLVQNIPMVMKHLDYLNPKLLNEDMNDRYFHDFIHHINSGFPLNNININRSNHTIQDYNSAQLIIFLKKLTTNHCGLYFDLDSGDLKYLSVKESIENHVPSWLFFDQISLIKFTRTKTDEFNDRYTKSIDGIWAKITRYPIVVNELYEVSK